MAPQDYMDRQLYKAAKSGDITFLGEKVKGDSCRLLRPTRQGNTAIHLSVGSGRLDFVVELYDALLQCNSSSESETDNNRSLSLLTKVNSVGDTALHIAAREGHAPILKFLLEKIMPRSSDQDVEGGNTSQAAREKLRMRNYRNHTALHEAVQRNYLDVVMLLIDADPDLSNSNYAAYKDDEEDGESPLYCAARNGYLEILKAILCACPSAAHDGPEGQTALHGAAFDGHFGVVEILLEKKGRELINKVDVNRWTALHLAASKRCRKTVELLLSHDTLSMYQLDKYERSPLHIAAKESSISVFQELIHACPDSVEILGDHGYNVLHFTVMSKDYKKIKFALRQRELQELINQPDSDGNTPFHLAVKTAPEESVKLFSSNSRVNVKAKNKDGHTASEVKYYDLQERKKLEVGKDMRREKELEKTLQIVASLIATVTFAAVFQVPGGYNSDNGMPVLQDNRSFQLFLVFDALAMCTSVASLVIMLVAPVGSYLFYTISLLVAKFLIYVALIFTSIAFLEGFRAILPHDCAGRFCFSGHSNQTFSIITIFVILSLSYVPFAFILSLYHTGFLVRKISEVRMASSDSP